MYKLPNIFMVARAGGSVRNKITIMMIMMNDEDDDIDDGETYRPNGASMFLYIAVVTPIGQFE